MKDSELIKKCIKNDREAQNELYRRYKDTLYFTSLKYCRNQTDAEDNLHDAFIAIFQKIKIYKHRGSFEGWMKRITIYKAIDKYKTRKTINIEIKDELLEKRISAEEYENLSIDQLLSLVQELPDQYRLVFNLFQLEELSHKKSASY